jgi:hypothetical protein
VYADKGMPWFHASAPACLGESERADQLLLELKAKGNPWVPFMLSHRLVKPLFEDPRMPDICREVGIPVPPFAR